jgi:uncharacterized membrane protein YidH (DUF202 family)
MEARHVTVIISGISLIASFALAALAIERGNERLHRVASCMFLVAVGLLIVGVILMCIGG